jgi:hypothetical protein
LRFLGNKGENNKVALIFKPTSVSREFNEIKSNWPHAFTLVHFALERLTERIHAHPLNNDPKHPRDPDCPRDQGKVSGYTAWPSKGNVLQLERAKSIHQNHGIFR